jgi:hypothetical protein
MRQQLEFDFRSPEEIAKQRKISEENEKVLNDMFSNDDYVYNRYVDFLLDLIPFRWGWRAKNWPRAIKWWAKCKYQKIRYGVSDDDVYSLGYNIALFILPRLKYFKKKGKTGIPCCFLPDNFHLLKDEEQTAAEEKGVKEMGDALDEMIFAFEYIIDGDKFCELPESLSFKAKDLDFNSEKSIEEKESWKQYMEKANELNDRKNNGLILFAKYYDTLWI